MISVIIPTLDEEARMPNLLRRLMDEPGPLEIIVVDGGSGDETVSVCRDAGVRVLMSPPGRGQQLRLGAEKATGDVLLFLHADCAFPKGGIAALTAALAGAPECGGGNFRLLFDGGDGFSRWLNGFYAFIRRLGIYYGDSGIFVRRETYGALGGIRPMALMEDYDFTRRLEALGPTHCINDPPLVTSSRRFRGRKPAAIVLGWLKIHLLYYLGLPPERLARLYDSERRRSRSKVRNVQSV